jgi:hypothetical protein
MASQFPIAGFAGKNLWHRRLRTILTLCGIGVAIGAHILPVKALRHD